MKRLKIFLALTAFAALVAAVAYAEQKENRLEARFNEYDTNSDGVLAGTELDASPLLKRLDLNGDGRITKPEALQGLIKLRQATNSTPSASESASTDSNKTGPVFNRLDANHDGKLTPDELKEAEIFAKLDTNKDGGVTMDEAIKVIGQVIPASWMKRGAADAPPLVENKSLQEQPKILKGTEHGVGRRLTDFVMVDTSGKEHRLSTLTSSSKAIVIAMFGATCPISGKLGPELARLEKEYTARGVAFLFVTPVAGETPTDIAKFVSTHGLSSPIINDEKSALASQLNATTTTEVFVVDAARTLVYRGAVNDQYGLGYAKDKPSKNYLREALSAVLSGQSPTVAATTAPGCALDSPKTTAAPTPSPLTYHNEISRILQGHCTECHRADGLAPFSLETYADVLKHAGMMKKQITRGAMPPWFAARSEDEKESLWANDCSLTTKDKSDLLAWLDSDRLQGNAKDAPIARTWPAEWSIGKPDMIVQLPRPVSIQAEGTMPYQVITAETTLTEGKWVQGYEIIPTDRAVVHHVIVSLRKKGEKTKRADNEEEGSSGYWAAYVPGNSKQIYPPGFAKKLPAGGVFSFQIHYTPNGKATQDQLRMGIIFAAQTPQYQVVTTGVPKHRLNIPPGEANHSEVLSQTVPFDMNIMAFMAHMHVRGKAFKYEVERADGSYETLLDLPHYDFNWQLRYDLAQPRILRRGSTLRISAIFDNSAGNAANPDPTKTVRWGPQTTDEMMIGYIEHFMPVSPSQQAQVN